MFTETDYGSEPDSNWDDPDEEVVTDQFDDWDEDYEASCREDW